MEADATTFVPVCIIDNFYKPINHKRPLTRDTFVEVAARDDKNVGLHQMLENNVSGD
jgi:hypothetical protein